MLEVAEVVEVVAEAEVVAKTQVAVCGCMDKVESKFETVFQ